jgi:hypothetical protein
MSTGGHGTIIVFQTQEATPEGDTSKKIYVHVNKVAVHMSVQRKGT